MREEEFKTFTKDRTGLIGWFMILFVIFTVALFVFAVGIGQIGFAYFPILSKIALFRSGPTRAVDASHADVGAMQTKIETAIRSAYKASDGKFVPVDFVFSEEDVTALIQAEFNIQKESETDLQSGDSSFIVKKAQVAFDHEQVEFYADFTGEISALGLSNVRTNSSMQMVFRPYLEDQKIRFQVKSVRISGVPLPNVMVESVVAQLLGAQLEKFNKDIVKKMTIQELVFEKGIMKISAQLKPGEAFVIEQVAPPRVP